MLTPLRCFPSRPELPSPAIRVEARSRDPSRARSLRANRGPSKRAANRREAPRPIPKDASLMTIVWRDAMSIDNGLIDEDHKSLISLVNAVDEVQPGREMRGRIAAILEQLDAYTRVHFEREERLQIKAHFIYSDAHGL